MRSVVISRFNPAKLAALAATTLVLFAVSDIAADEQPNARPMAPAGYSIFESDMTGSYFVTKPLKDKYDSLLKRVDELRTDIDQARIDESQARRVIVRLQSEIDETLREVEKTKLYIPGATVQNRAATKTIPFGAQDLLFIEAENVEIRGGEGTELKCVVKKTVLGEFDKDQDLAAEFDGIELVIRKSTGKEMFGFYKTAAGRPDLKPLFDQFPFKPLIDREFTVITMKGLSYQEGNRQITVESRSEAGGDGSIGSQWRRHAKLIVTVPKCQGVAIQGALGGLRAHSLNGSLMIQGTGNRDYHARYQVTDQRGSLTASGIPIHDIDGVTGDVSIIHTSYNENISTSHGPDGVAIRPFAPKPARYKEIQGNLQVNFCRADLTLEGIGGRVDVQNDFGNTVWRSLRTIAATDHRIVSQSGTVELGFAPDALGKLTLALLTSCGVVRLPHGDAGFQSKMFAGNIGDTVNRSWNGFVSGSPSGDSGDSVRFYKRMPAALRGDRRAAGVDIISRAGTVTYEPIAEGAPVR